MAGARRGLSHPPPVTRAPSPLDKTSPRVRGEGVPTNTSNAWGVLRLASLVREQKAPSAAARQGDGDRGTESVFGGYEAG